MTRPLPFSIGSAAFGIAAIAASGSSHAQPPPSRVERPDLGQAAPPVAVVFPDAGAPTGTPAAIYLWGPEGWTLVFRGAFVRGSLLAGRGGIGNRYRLIDRVERAFDLTMADGKLVLKPVGRP